MHTYTDESVICMVFWQHLPFRTALWQTLRITISTIWNFINIILKILLKTLKNRLTLLYSNKIWLTLHSFMVPNWQAIINSNMDRIIGICNNCFIIALISLILMHLGFTEDKTLLVNWDNLIFAQELPFW